MLINDDSSQPRQKNLERALNDLELFSLQGLER